MLGKLSLTAADCTPRTDPTESFGLPYPFWMAFHQVRKVGENTGWTFELSSC